MPRGGWGASNVSAASTLLGSAAFTNGAMFAVAAMDWCHFRCT